MNIDIKPNFYKDIEKLKKENPKYLGKVFELM